MSNSKVVSEASHGQKLKLRQNEFSFVLLLYKMRHVILVSGMTGDRDVSMALLSDLQVGKIERKNEQFFYPSCVEPLRWRETLA